MEFRGFTRKQREVISSKLTRLTILTGGVRAGKTVLTYFFIPLLLEELGEIGKGILIGKTLGSLNENVIEPMRELYGERYVSEMKTDASGVKYILLFGHRVRCVGANDKKAENKIRGATYSWAVGDEVSTWDRKTFDMLMSRLSVVGAKCVITTNPDNPSHWLNKDYILKEGIDKQVWTFTIDDNEYLDREYVENLKNIYRGTELYDRFILGLWASGTGAIYKKFIAEIDKYIVDEVDPKDIVAYNIGVDFGENTSATTFQLLGLYRGYRGIVVLEEEYITKHGDVKLLQEQFLSFLKRCYDRGWKPSFAYYDCAQKTLGESLKTAVLVEGYPLVVDKCYKEPILDRIHQEQALMGAYMFKVCRHCVKTIEAFKDAVWSDKVEERLDDGTSNIDTLDATEYAFQKWAKNLMLVCLSDKGGSNG